jgi:N-acylneuraminate cytidylyltransferase
MDWQIKNKEQNNMKKIAIITARGGSKRIPHKNIKDFCGKPILAYSIEAALKSNLFDTVMVSTDDAKIAEIAKQYGAEVPFFRSEEASNDYASTNDVLLEVLDEYEKRGEHYDLGCCIYPTAPFVTPEKLKTAVETLINSDADTLIPVVRFSYPPQRAMVIKEGRLVFNQPEYLESRSQDLEPHYHDVGQFYIFKTDAFKVNKNLMLGNILPLEISEMEVQDIDNITDWEIAEIKYRKMVE